MLHPSGISSTVVDFKLIEVKKSSHCTGVEKGVDDEMIHLFGDLMKTYSFAGMHSHLNSLVISDYLSGL
jgi:hypothetical protein